MPSYNPGQRKGFQQEKKKLSPASLKALGFGKISSQTRRRTLDLRTFLPLNSHSQWLACISTKMFNRHLKPNRALGLPWWSSGEESTCQCRAQGQVPGWGRYHVTGLLNPASQLLSRCSGVHELQLLKPTCSRAHNKRSYDNENPEHCNYRKPICSKEDSVQPNNNNFLENQQNS